MKLDAGQIATREVLDWEGLHLLNYCQSSCSQKVRILLAEKGVDYRSREVDIKSGEHTTAWYLGINSRGVVPVLVDNGQVHIESNDILRYIDETFPAGSHPWLPIGADQRDLADDLLQLEDDLHIHLRAVTMGFLLPRSVAAKSEQELEAYANNGPADPHRADQVQWWREFAEHGITEQQARDATVAFHRAFTRLDDLVTDREWLLGDRPTVLDIAWFISLYRVVLAGYPLEEHPALHALFKRMKSRRAFRAEVAKGPFALKIAGPIYRATRRLRGSTLKSIYNQIQRTLESPLEGTTL